MHSGLVCDVVLFRRALAQDGAPARGEADLGVRRRRPGVSLSGTAGPGVLKSCLWISEFPAYREDQRQ